MDMFNILCGDIFPTIMETANIMSTGSGVAWRWI